MEIGIAGLPGAGKTTVFNALARAHAQVGAFSTAASEPHRAVVKVPDPRVDTLVDLFKPKSIKPAEVQFVDVAGLARRAGLESNAALLGHLRTVDALLLVIAAFGDSVAAEDAVSDLQALEAEFILADLEVVDRRLERLDREVRMARGADAERQAKATELALLARLKEALDHEIPIRTLDLQAEEEKLLRGYALLSAKPILPVLNTGDDPGDGERLMAGLAVHPAGAATEWLPIAGRLEMELAELDSDDAQEFMEAMGIHELAASRVIQASYRLLDLISFFTVGPDEVRAWTIRRGDSALDAAAAIHSDLARGFIRAEVVTYDELVAARTLVEARKRGRLRSEGKTYVVQDGDICHILFNV
jgi:GTP-binding protein YchF